MPEPFKNLFNQTVIDSMAHHFKKAWPEFEDAAFIATAANDLDSLELKERSNQITDAMIEHLPDDFINASDVLLASLGTSLRDDLSWGISDAGIGGWGVMPMAHYVALKGHDHFALSMHLLKEMTKRSSSEFAIRFFLIAKPQETISALNSWITDPNPHVRRLISEGSRPRLPWGQQLPAFIKDPAPVLVLLEQLKDDESEYVRRSVANNLNDIAKDHPDIVADIAKSWLQNASSNRKKLIKHACRTLIKNGHQPTLKALGYQAPKIKDVQLAIHTPVVQFGNPLEFSLALASDSDKDQPLIVDYVIHHRKANGKTSPKVFKWKTTKLPASSSSQATRKHPIKKITTRVYYPGTHTIEIKINGISIAEADFELQMP